MKPTAFLTNSPAMERYVATRCDGTHTHLRLEGIGRTTASQVYPQKLVDELSGVKLQKQWDDDGRFQLGYIHNITDVSLEAGEIPPEESYTEWMDESDMVAWDDVTGMGFDAKMVERAKAEEMMFYEKLGAYTRVDKSEVERTGGKLADVRWIGISKGDSAQPNYRSRLVGR